MSYIGGAYTANPDRREKKPAHLLSNIIEQYDRYKDRFGGDDKDTPNNDYDTLQQEGQPPVAPPVETPAEQQEPTVLSRGYLNVETPESTGRVVSNNRAENRVEKLSAKEQRLKKLLDREWTKEEQAENERYLKEVYGKDYDGGKTSVLGSDKGAARGVTQYPDPDGMSLEELLQMKEFLEGGSK